MNVGQGIAERTRRHPRWAAHFAFGSGAPPVLVLQMGKVRSLSVLWAILRQTRFPVSDLYSFELRHPRWRMRVLQARYNAGDPLRIITPIREPAGRPALAALENFEKISRSYPECLGLEGIARVINDSWHDHPGDWFEANIRKPFGIDVYETPFPDSGFQVYESGETRFLVYKVELGMFRIEEILRRYLSVPGLTLKRENEFVKKSYGDAYRRLKDLESLDIQVIEWLRSDRYARHLYPST